MVGLWVLVCFFLGPLFLPWELQVVCGWSLYVCRSAWLGKAGNRVIGKQRSCEWSLRTYQCITSTLGEKLSLLQQFWGQLRAHRVGKAIQVSVVNRLLSVPLRQAKSQTNLCCQAEDHKHSQEICLSPGDFNLKMLPFLTQRETAAFSHQRLAFSPIGILPSGLMLANYSSHPFTTDQHPNNPTQLGAQPNALFEKRRIHKGGRNDCKESLFKILQLLLES